MHKLIIFKGNDKFAYRDPACFYKDGTYYLFFTVSEKDNGYMYNRIGLSKSTDLKNWTEPEILTEKNYNTNYCSPGNIIEKDGEYIICFTSYPMPYPFEEKSWADENARLFTMKTKDFKTFTKPEILNPKTGTPNNEIGRMIDPFLIKKGDYYYIYFKQNGVSYSRSKDLVNWEFIGNTKGGENACVIEKDGGYLLIHSPENGIGFSKSKDLEKWEDMGSTTLKQDEWEWAQGRLTAAFAMEAPKDFKYKYIIFFHGSENVFPETHGNATVAMAVTDNFEEFYYET